MALDDLYQVNVNHLIAGREISNVFYYSETTAAGGGPIIVAGALNLEFWSAIWLPWWDRVISVDCQLTAIWSRRIWPTVEQAATSYFGGEFGEINDDAVPNGSCVLISAHAVGNDANYRRRMYISGLPEIHSAASKVVDAQLSNWQDLADAFTATDLKPPSLFPATFDAAAYSRKRDAASDPQPWELLGFNKLTPFLRSQRGRNRRR